MMMSHKHSFQCFDAVVDEPSLTVRCNCTLPCRSSFTSTHLDKLENHSCSICSESQQTKPVTSNVSGNQSASGYPPQSLSHQYKPRRPMEPKREPVNGLTYRHNHHHHQYRTHRHCKRIVLVMNSNPFIQKTILLHSKLVYNLGVFMDDVSELMQCFIRTLYTLDGRKVGSVQSLLQGPGILVCVGREPLHPLLLDTFQKNFKDKLPELSLKSRVSAGNKDQGYKKSVTSGLKSKKRLPPIPLTKARANLLDDGIEKRVLVNKDGSLSMEMKVRFLLPNDETLHCSTEIKKASCNFNASSLEQDDMSCPHCGHGESCSEAESMSFNESDEVYLTKLYLKHLEEPHCQYCCTHCQKYDIWKNPAFNEQESLRHIGSTSSSTPSHKIKCKQESVDSTHIISCEEYNKHVVEKPNCIPQTVRKEDLDDTTVQCIISRCSHSEVCSVCTVTNKASYTDEKNRKKESTHTFTKKENRPVPSKNLKQDQRSVRITQISIDDGRPLSSLSSDNLAYFKEDEDKTDLSPSHPRTTTNNKEHDEHTRNTILSPYLFTPCETQESTNQSLSPITSSRASFSCLINSKSLRKFVVTESQANGDQAKNSTPSSTPHWCQHEESTDMTIENGTFEKQSEAINQSEEENIEVTSHVMSADSFPVTKTKPEEPADFLHEVKSSSAKSPKSNISACLGQSKSSEVTCKERQKAEHQKEGRVQSRISVYSNVSTKPSTVSETVANRTEDQTEEVMPCGLSKVSGISQRSKKSKESETLRQDTSDEDNRESALSAMPCKSIILNKCVSDGVDNEEPIPHLFKETESVYEEIKDDMAASAMSLSITYKDVTQERAPSSMSTKSNVYRKSKNFKMDHSKDECEGKHERSSILASPNLNMSARSRKTESLVIASSAEVENQSTENSWRTKFQTSNTSKTSTKNIVLDCLKEPKQTEANAEELVERSPSAKSNTAGRTMEKIHHSTISTKSTTSLKDFSTISSNSPNADVVKSGEMLDINIEKTAPTHMSAKSGVSSKSVKSNISTLAGGQTELVCLNETFDSALTGLKISITENTNNSDSIDRASTALSKNSNTSSVNHISEIVLSPASASVSTWIVEEYDVNNAEEDNSMSSDLVNSTPQLNSKTDVCCKDASQIVENKNLPCMKTPDDRNKSSLIAGTIVSDISKKSDCAHKNSSQPKTHNEMAKNKSVKQNSKNSFSHSLRSGSSYSDFQSSKTKDRNSPAVIDKPKRHMSSALLYLEVNGQSRENSQCEWSTSNLSGDRYSKKGNEEISRRHSTDISISSVSTNNSLLRQKSKEPVISLTDLNHQSSSTNGNSNKLSTNSDFKVKCKCKCNGSLGAADCGRNINDNKNEKDNTSICRHSSNSLAQKVDMNSSELIPSTLPNPSPAEVVNEWLKNIPMDSALYELRDEFPENCKEELQKISGKETQHESIYLSEGDADVTVLRQKIEHEEIINNDSELSEMKETTKDLAVQGNIFPDVPASVQLMRILLSPKLDRCNSLPEVSAVYGRKLSISARGFLDSLVNLQLLDFNSDNQSGKTEKYNNLMNILHSLWLCDPSDRVVFKHKDNFNNQQSVTVKSSSELDINSSSEDSVKSNVNEGTTSQTSQTNIQYEGSEILKSRTDISEIYLKSEPRSDSATPDIASRAQWTPESQTEENMQDNNILSAVSDFTESEPPDTVCISNMRSGNPSNVIQTPSNHEDGTNSESLSSEQMAQLTKDVSQDPESVWVLNLLTKIEKQFMTQYVTAMAEFKARWNLHDNEQLDVMICELRDEVHKRIQVNINNELRKIQGHAGRPKPPKETMARESHILTEQRRRRLKLNLNQSINPAPKTESTTILKTLQRNDDKYCPCDTSIKMKSSSRPVLAMDVSKSVPVMMDFDLKNILHLKIKPPTNSKENVQQTEEQHAEGGNLADADLLKIFQQEKTLKPYKAKSELQAQSIEQKQNESDTSNDKGFGKEYTQAAVARKVRSSSSLEEDAFDTQPNKSKLWKNDQAMKECNNTTRAIKQEGSRAGGELREHVELRNETEIRRMASADPNAEWENVQSGPADMGTETKITDEEEICDELDERKGAIEGESLREGNAIGGGTTNKNMAIEGGTVGEQEVAKGISAEGKGAEVATLDAESGYERAEEKIVDKKDSVGERTIENNEVVEGEISECESEAENEIPDYEKEKNEDATTETTWNNKELKIKSEIIDDENKPEPKSDRKMWPEDGTDEDDTTETESTEKDEENYANESAEGDVAITKIRKESCDLCNEERISELDEDRDITDLESEEGGISMNDESAKEGETDSDELDAIEKTTNAETAGDEEPPNNETAEYREKVYDDSAEIIEKVGKTNNNIATEDRETSEAKTEVDFDYESTEDAETSKTQKSEDT